MNMKRFSILMLCLSLILLSGMLHAGAEECSHYAQCTEPGICALCGAEYAGTNIQHEFSKYVGDETGHWRVCQHCDTVRPDSSKYSHEAYCKFPGICNFCGYSDANIEITIHVGEGYAGANETHHWQECTLCGEQYGIVAHWASCTSPTMCGSCGTSSITPSEIWHGGEYDYVSDENGHWWECEDCNGTVEGGKGTVSPHYAKCSDPTKCAACGADYTGTDVSHSIDYNSYEYDETQHWYPCEDCDYKEYPEDHYASCADPAKCTVCGADYSGTDISHRYNYSIYRYDATSHWNECQDCGDKKFVSAHSGDCADPTKCKECGAAYSGTDISHSYDYSTYKYDTTSHWRECRDCGDKQQVELHFSNCKTPNICNECGATCTPTEVAHTPENEWGYDDYACWQTCKDCGKILNKFTHSTLCSEPNVCYLCNAVVEHATVEHEFNFTSYGSDSLSHWYICKLCGEKDSVSPHTAACDNPTVCMYCGALYNGMDYSHTTIQYHDDTHHWRECLYCGEITSFATHFAQCYDPNHCRICGFEGVMKVDHNGTKWLHDEEGHWQVCRWCQEIFNQASHTSICTDPNACTVCAFKDDAVEVTHKYDYTKYFCDGELHWYQCKECEGRTKAENHVVNCGQTKCVYCGTEVTNVQDGYVRHAYDTSAFAGNGSAHWHACTQCGGKIDEAEHTPSDADPAVCGVCGLSISTVTVGDLTGDGILDGRDVLRLMKMLANASSVSDEAADLNGDGVGDGRDVLRLMRNVGQ